MSYKVYCMRLNVSIVSYDCYLNLLYKHVTTILFTSIIRSNDKLQNMYECIFILLYI